MQRIARIKAGIARMERINRYKGVNLYVNILDPNIDDERLRKEFSEFGIITSAKVITTDGRSKGFGFVSFSFPEEATNALTEMNMQRIASIRMQGVEELNGVDIHGKTLFAGRAQKMTERQTELKDKFERIRMESINRYQGVNLYVNKLDANIDDERLRKEFSEFGIITSAKVMTKDGRSKGFGFVCFSSPEEATNVLTEMNGRIVVAKPLYVALAQRNDNRKAHLASQYMQRIASIKMQTDKMATSNYVLCSICEAQHTIKNSDNWCPECEEGLCSECLKHHNVSKYTKSHEVISIENYQQIPQSVSRIVQHCTEHDRQHQNYCPMHESLCCPQCISEDHTDCVGLLAIENIVKTAKTSAMLDSIDDTLKDMFSNMERMIRDREENLTKITDQRRKIHNEIQEERRKINEHLDKLEEQVIGNLDTEEAKIKSEIQNLLENLNKKAVTIAMLQSKLSALKLYGSDLQTFLGGRTILREVEEEEMYVTALLEDKCLQQINLCYRPEAKMAAINNIEIFGSVCKETNPPAINIKRGKDKQAQIMTFTPPVRNVSIHDINLVLLRKKERICNQITGCTITPNGKFIFADYDTKGLNILSEDWTSDNLDTKLPDIQYAFDVTCIDDTRLAISTGKQINILNIASKQIKKIINTSGWCYGITQNEGSLLFCEISRGISRVQLSDNSISLLVKQEAFPNHTYVIASGDNIYHTNNTTNTVSCHKITGDKLWELQDVAIIRNLRGVAVDRDLNVYVASLGNDSVVVISPDGKRCRTVLGKSDGIDRPTAIYFDKLKNKLVVCNYNATAFLYKVE